jgi:hypothetical protein
MIVFNILFQNWLVISRDGIRYIYHWNEKWENIKSYNLNVDSGVLTFHLKERKQRTVNIDRKDYNNVLTNIGVFTALLKSIK